MSDHGDLTAAHNRARIYGWAYRLMRNDHDALDATQSVLVKALTSQLPAADKRQAWLRRVTVNHCLDLLRRERRQPPPFQPGTAHTSGDSRLEQQEQHERLAAALGELSDMQRLILLTKTFDGASFEIIAGEMGLSAATVKTHYLRALRKMRALLAGTEGAST